MNLEGHFLSGTGAGNQWGGLFGRQANVGLSSSAGTLTAGAMYSPAILAYAATDPRGLKESFSGLMTWAFTQNGTHVGAPGDPATSILDIFLKNAVQYSIQMPMGWMSSTDGLNVAVAYALGGIAGSTSANRTISVGVSYTGPLVLSFGYQSSNGQTAAASGNANTKFTIGAGYTFGLATVKANYLDNKGKDPATGAEVSHYKVYGIGLDYKLTDSDTVTLAYYDGKNDDRNADTGKSIILSNDFALSKRTTLYALIANDKAGSGATYGSSAYNGDNFAAPPIAGSNSMAFQLGIKHAF
jgi:predicted porin